MISLGSADTPPDVRAPATGLFPGLGGGGGLLSPLVGGHGHCPQALTEHTQNNIIKNFDFIITFFIFHNNQEFLLNLDKSHDNDIYNLSFVVT